MRAAYENTVGMFEKVHENETQFNDFAVFVKKTFYVQSFRKKLFKVMMKMLTAMLNMTVKCTLNFRSKLSIQVKIQFSIFIDVIHEIIESMAKN